MVSRYVAIWNIYLDRFPSFCQNYQNRWKFDEVLTKTNLLSFLGHGVYIITEAGCQRSRKKINTYTDIGHDLLENAYKRETFLVYRATDSHAQCTYLVVSVDVCTLTNKQ